MFIEPGSELNITQNPISNQTISIGDFWISASSLPLTAFSNAFSNAFFQTSSVPPFSFPPEFSSPGLNKSIDQIILELTEKGLI
jgi:hypothetical protein